MPGDVDETGGFYYIRVDRVSYSVVTHPEYPPDGVDHRLRSPDGRGILLTRRISSDYGADPDNWIASEPSPDE